MSSSDPKKVTPERRDFGIAVLGGPTVVIDIAGHRFLSDPTFDPPRDFGYLRKTNGPALEPEELGVVDAVLLSHDVHPDNFDGSGRTFALAAPLVLTTPSAAQRLGPPAVPLHQWQTWSTPTGTTVTAVPAQHGPDDGEVDADGFINCEVAGFVVRAPEGRSVYVSGDNASLAVVREIRDRLGPIQHAVLFGGAASVPTKFGGRPLSLTAERAATAAQILGATHVVVAHQDGWSHFTQGPTETRSAFHRAGLQDILGDKPLGHWDTGNGQTPAPA
jgi:L-ascorbate metabolism protein UlaG (beta-lactamase superfamily)